MDGTGDGAQHRRGERSATVPEATPLDLRGLKCPLPALRARRRLLSLAPGALLELLADDPMAPLDIEHLCRTEGHDLVSRDAAAPSGWRFVIRRAPF